MKRLLTPLLTLALAVALGGAAHADKSAEAAATAWLALLDGGQYQQTYDTASPAFRQQVPASAWLTQIKQIRGQLGKTTSRTLTSAQATTTLPNAPKGEYVVLKYKTAFEKRPSSIETVVMSKAPDGKWHVGGYFIK